MAGIDDAEEVGFLTVVRPPVTYSMTKRQLLR